jgi:hypothetical protein
MKQNAFGITEDGMVYRLCGKNMDERLGHIACILNDCNSQTPPQSALDVRDWWGELMSSDGLIEDYVPHAKYQGVGLAIPKAEISGYDSEALEDVLQEILPAA